MSNAMTKPAPSPDPPDNRSLIRGGVIAALVLAVVIGLVALWIGPPRHREPVNARFHAGDTVAIEATTADVSIVAADVTEIEVGGELRWLGNRQFEPAAMRGGALELPGCGNSWSLLVLGNACHARYEIRVPKDRVVDVQLTTGDLTFVGPLGAVRTRTTTGDLDVRRLSAPSLVATATTGDLQIGSGIGDIQATVSTGDITADVSASGFDAASTTGDITATFEVTPEAVSATAHTGDVTLRVPAGGYQVTGSASTGDVTVDQSLVDAAGDRTITAETTTGDIRVGVAR